MRRIFELGGVASAHYRGFGRPLDLPDDLALVAHTHCLPSAASTLFPWLIGAGLPPERILVITKPYSTIPRSLAALRKRGLILIEEPDPCGFPDYDSLSRHLLREGLGVAKARFGGASRLLLLDDGGMLTEAWSGGFREIAGETVSIQQTSSGVRRESLPDWKIPYVDIARSVAKTVFESPAIAGGIIRKLDSLGECAGRSAIGIVGLGAIGSRVANGLAEKGKRVFAFDISETIPELRTAQVCASTAELLDRADIVIGCTGKDWMSEGDLDHLWRRPHHLVSASSRDIEFQRLLSAPCAQRLDAGFGALDVLPPLGEPQRVLNGGYPVNFDRRREWESAREMVLTRLLLFAGVLQAASLKMPADATSTKRAKLHPGLQRSAVREWLRLIRQKPRDFGVDPNALEDLNWWRQEPEQIIAYLAEAPPKRLTELDRISPALSVWRKLRR